MDAIYIPATETIDRLEPWMIEISSMLHVADANTQMRYPAFSWTKLALEKDTIQSFLEGLLSNIEAHVRVDPSPTPYQRLQQGYSSFLEPLMNQQGTMNAEVYQQLESSIYEYLHDQATIYTCDAAIIDKCLHEGGHYPDVVMTPQLKEELYYAPFKQEWIMSLAYQLSLGLTQLIGQVVLPIYFHHSTPLDRQRGIYISLYTGNVKILGNQVYLILLPRIHISE